MLLKNRAVVNTFQRADPRKPVGLAARLERKINLAILVAYERWAIAFRVKLRRSFRWHRSHFRRLIAKELSAKSKHSANKAGGRLGRSLESETNRAPAFSRRPTRKGRFRRRVQPLNQRRTHQTRAIVGEMDPVRRAQTHRRSILERDEFAETA